MSDLLEAIERAWSWKGFVPSVLINQNAFGNLIVMDQANKYWRICPEELSCAVVARDPPEFERLRAEAEFQSDWAMANLCAIASQTVGPLAEGRCYCLKIPAVLGGAYDASNLGEIALDELISFSGDLARQIDGLPDGAQIRLLVGD